MDMMLKYIPIINLVCVVIVGMYGRTWGKVIKKLENHEHRLTVLEVKDEMESK